MKSLLAATIATLLIVPNTQALKTESRSKHPFVGEPAHVTSKIDPGKSVTIKVDKREKKRQSRAYRGNSVKQNKGWANWVLQKLSLSGASDHRLPQTNNMNLEYIGKLYMGSEREPVKLVFDTGSDWLTIETHECVTCDGDTYDWSDDSTYEKVPNSNGERGYGSSWLWGYEAKDQVCLDDVVQTATSGLADACISGFQFFAITESEGMDGIEGIAGMSTGFSGLEGPLLVQELAESGVIEAPVFGWYMSGLTDMTYIDIGKIQEDAMSNPDDLVWLEVVDNDFWWTNFIEGISFDGEQFAVDKGYGMTDTGTSCSYIPDQYFKSVLEQITSNVDAEVTDFDEYIVDCRDVYDLPTVEFLYGGYWMQMDPRDYVVELEGMCFLCLFSSGEDPYWILGDTFLRGFYSTYDHANKRHGFVPHATSTKSAAYPGDVPEQALGATAENPWLYWIIVMVISCILCCCCLVAFTLIMGDDWPDRFTNWVDRSDS